MRPAPVTALVSFPRVEHDRLARSVGVAALLSKPTAVEDLCLTVLSDSVPNSLSSRGEPCDISRRI